jgi:hypothetical protein
LQYRSYNRQSIKSNFFDIDGEDPQRQFDKVIKAIDYIEVENAVNNTMQTRTGSGSGKHIAIAINQDKFQKAGNLYNRQKRYYNG